MIGGRLHCTTTTSNVAPTWIYLPPMACLISQPCMCCSNCWHASLHGNPDIPLVHTARRAQQLLMMPSPHTRVRADGRHYLRRMGTDGVHGSPESPPGSEVHQLSSSLPSPTTSHDDAADSTRHARVLLPSAGDTDGLSACAARPVTAKGRVEQQGSRLGVGVSAVQPSLFPVASHSHSQHHVKKRGQQYP